MAKLGSYSIESTLGSGSFGEVFKVRKHGKTYAIKKVDQVDESALQEVKILRMVNHTYIINYIDSFYCNHALCIVMEFADGGTLTDFVQSKATLPSWGDSLGAEGNIWRILSHFCGALHYLHTFQPNHIMHRDLKPDNILVFTGALRSDAGNGNGVQLKLADFGIAKLLNSNAQHNYYTNTDIGTPIYMAPEIFQNKAYTFSADMWSVGAMMSFCINAGKHLFTNQASIMTWSGGKMTLPSHYSTELRQLVANLLNPNPRGRPTAAEVKSECTDDRQEIGIHGENDENSSWCTII